MEGAMKNGSSIYHRFLCLLTRSADGTLLSSGCTGPSKSQFIQNWDKLQRHLSPTHLLHGSPRVSSFELPFTLPETETDASDYVSTNIILVESWSSCKRFILGATIAESPLENARNADAYFLKLVLQSLHILYPGENALDAPLNDKIVERIGDIFDSDLRYVGPHDKWSQMGRSYFLSRVRYYIQRGAQIEFALPAFPCKSSNPDKVAGELPDRGEYVALQTLHSFVQDVAKIYPPGATIWIISDGHVFSDCIGVDDDTVTAYTNELRSLNDTIAGDAPNHVRFQSLVEILKLGPKDGLSLIQDRLLNLSQVHHHIDGVQLDDEAELCRRILMAGFKASTSKLRSRIDAKDPSILALYRGFSRFMLEDLENNAYTAALSKSQRRKLSSKVAFEMIERNQAYSNLVEMVFPHHVRLSIHAHDNAGPKFGISMMGDHVRSTNKLSEAEPAVSHDLLHVPTPWHSTMVEVQGHEHLYLTKTTVVNEALEDEELVGEWVSAVIAPGGELNDSQPVAVEERGDGDVAVAFFQLRPKAGDGNNASAGHTDES